MTREQLRRIDAITDNFFFWQGLRLVPIGAALLACAAAYAPNVPLLPTVRSWFGLVVVAVALWLSTSVGRYYDRHFGRVHGDPSRHSVRTSVKWFVVYPAIAIAFLVDARFHPPVVVSGLALAGAIEAFRESTGGGREHYTAAAIGLVVFSILPLWSLVPTGKAALVPLIGLLGLIYIAGGLLDHRELVRMLAPIQEEAHGSSV